ncbi:MAG: hypothetical protein K9J37_16485 [Saprospiraceae bacterium]|nr:hypothetical protein [Saprospiraceae bacterium]MCF8251512.1 hypothetical protein [Saprospiraceae bacterium]MCF8280763.1 hypothetical protein [Bacteroidales bacterium]MCF8313372.1 hypothetical protein [Saprospiraceae bacterium]MCF8441808.1 hypothetical protein [Saprospiraceae bacterium]
MLGETYPIISVGNGLAFTFNSVEPKGMIQKIVLFQWYDLNCYNLAFGDIVGGFLSDETVSNNQDFVKVLGTVAKCAYQFVERQPGVILKITPVDEGRKMLYNAVFKRHHKTIAEKFDINGRVKEALEAYDPEKLYDEFELKHNI